MTKFAVFLLEKIDIVLGSAIIVISGITFIFWAIMKRKQQGSTSDDEVKKLLLKEMSDPKLREQYVKGLASIWVYFPFVLVNFLLLLGITNPYILLVVIVLLILSEIIYLIRKPLSTIALLDYTDTGIMFYNVVFHNFILLTFLCGLEYLKLRQIVLSSKLIPVICWGGGLHGLFSLVYMAAGGKKNVLHKLSPHPLVWLTFAQSLTVISSWAVGSYLLAPALGYQNIGWIQWFRFLCVYQDSLIIFCLRWTGIGLMLTTAAIQCYFTARLLKAKRLRVTSGAIPSFLLLCGMICGGLYIMNGPNYLDKIGISLFDTLEIGIESWACTPSKIDGSLLVFPNGVPLYFENYEGLFLDYSIKIVDDFSSHPYLRIYSKTLYDGCLTIWVENQGEVDISNCKFDMTDSEGQLSEHFSKEALSVNVHEIASGEHFCLFYLRNADMVKPEYSEIPLSLSVTAEFDSNSQHWETVRTVPGEALMSIRGVTIEPSGHVYPVGKLLIPGESLHMSEEINYDGKQKVPSFYCDRTALLQIDISTITASRRELPWNPIFLVYEVE